MTRLWSSEAITTPNALIWWRPWECVVRGYISLTFGVGSNEKYRNVDTVTFFGPVCGTGQGGAWFDHTPRSTMNSTLLSCLLPLVDLFKLICKRCCCIVSLWSTRKKTKCVKTTPGVPHVGVRIAGYSWAYGLAAPGSWIPTVTAILSMVKQAPEAFIQHLGLRRWCLRLLPWSWCERAGCYKSTRPRALVKSAAKRFGTTFVCSSGWRDRCVQKHCFGGLPDLRVSIVRSERCLAVHPYQPNTLLWADSSLLQSLPQLFMDNKYHTCLIQIYIDVVCLLEIR